MGKIENQLAAANRPVEINVVVKPARTGRVRLTPEEFTRRRKEVEEQRKRETAHA